MKSGLFMCQICKFFLLQGPKGSMSDEARDFNKMETRAAIKYFSLQGKASKGIHAIVREILLNMPQRMPQSKLGGPN